MFSIPADQIIQITIFSELVHISKLAPWLVQQDPVNYQNNILTPSFIQSMCYVTLVVIIPKEVAFVVVWDIFCCKTDQL